ncbi:MAG: S8 family peptidase [Candidatus Magasanikbacteria bacterium]
MLSNKNILYTIILALILPSFVFAQTPNDPYYYQWAYNDIGVYEAWEYTTGSPNTVVAVIDNGFDTFHPDLRANAWKNEDEIPNNNIDDDKNGYIDDVWGWNFVAEDVNNDGQIDKKEMKGNNNPRPQVDNLLIPALSEHVFSHGTMVAGIIGARGNNKTDGVGINWEVKLMNIKVLGNTGSGNLDTIDDAIRYAVDNGADVINISMVGYYTEDMDKAVDYAYEQGVVVIAAAGNNSFSLNDNALYPICLDVNSEKQKILGVNAVNQDHRLTMFSNTGSSCIDLTAPGANVSSTVRFSPTDGLPNRYLGGWQGTSFAAPMISGVAALIKSIQPTWGPDKIYEAILSTVHYTPSEDEIGYAELFGAGMVQVDEAIRYAYGSVVNGNWQKIISFQNESGLASVRDVDNHDVEENLDFLSNADDIYVYKYKGGTFFAVIKEEMTWKRIFLFNDAGKEISKWLVEGDVDYNIAVGDLLGDSQVEVVLAPQGKSKTLYRIYDINGIELSQKVLADEHMGADLAVISTGGKKEIVAYYQDQNEKLLVSRFDNTGKELITFEVDYIKGRGEIITGDFDGNGVASEYALTGRENDLPFILFYRKTGELIRRFYAYSPSYRGILDIATIDYDNDGQDEVAVLSTAGDQSARIWRFEGKKSEIWWPFGESNKENLRLLVY